MIVFIFRFLCDYAAGCLSIGKNMGLFSRDTYVQASIAGVLV
jgi:hypothetical protein